MNINYSKVWFCKRYHKKIPVYNGPGFQVGVTWLPVCIVVFKNESYKEYEGDLANKIMKEWITYTKTKHGNKHTIKTNNERRSIRTSATARIRSRRYKVNSQSKG